MISNRGFPLITHALVALKTPQTIETISAITGIGYNPAMWLMTELERSGLIRIKYRLPAKRGLGAKQYEFIGGWANEDAEVREIMRRFLKLWNCLQQPRSAREVAKRADLNENHARRVIHRLKLSGLCRIAGWRRGRVSLPTALYEIGTEPDAPRPEAYTEQEYNRRAKNRRHSGLSERQNQWQQMLDSRS